MHEGNEDQGKYGKQGWSIARRCIAIAMDQGESIKIGSQIFPEFVQAQTVIFSHASILEYIIKLQKYSSKMSAAFMQYAG